MGSNMESLLLNDSSSGESDDEGNVTMSTATTAASAVTVAAPAPAPPPIAAPAPKLPSNQAPNSGAPASARGNSGQSDQMARLKSLYSISKSTGAPSPPQAAPKPLQRPPMPQQPQHPPQQQKMQQRQPHPQTQQRQSHQPVGSHQASQQQHQRSQRYQQSSQQPQLSSRSQVQQRQPQYSQPSSQSREQYSQQPQQRQVPQPIQHRQQPSQPIQHRQQPSQPMQHRQQPSQPMQHRQQPSQPMQHRQQPSQPIQHRQIHRTQQHSQSQSRGGSSSRQPGKPGSVDPFAPTPLNQIKQSQHRGRTHPQQRQPQQRQPQQMGRSHQTGRGSTAVPMTREQEVKRQKEKFLMFTRVLIKYLEQKDKVMHSQAKSIIKDCAERNKRQEPGYESVTISMKRRLKELVGEHYWKKANDYLVHFIEQKKKQQSNLTPQQKQQLHQRQQQQQLLQRQRQQQEAQRQKLKNEQMARQRGALPAVNAPSILKGIQEKREQIENDAQARAKPNVKKTKAASTLKAPGSDTKKAATKKKVVRRKSDTSTASRKATPSKMTPASSASISNVKRIVVEEPPREYKEIMESVDHIVDYDWPSIGQLLGNKADLKLTEEERQLLYGDSQPELSKNQAIKSPTKDGMDMLAARAPESSSTDNQDDLPKQISSDEQDEDDEKQPTADGIRPGWGLSNVVSVRAAWARVRLRELRQRKLEAASSAPVIADGLLTLPKAAPTASPQKQDQSTPPAAATAAATVPATSSSAPHVDSSVVSKPEVTEGSWEGEEIAEQDKALALLSEGCQIYLKGVLQKAIQCARQRQNLDGIRLWHQQYAFNKGSFGVNKSTDKSKKPPLALRLGCDVTRQAAQAQGNAALTVKRMEEALDRQTGIPARVRELNTETMIEATSMGDLAWRPLLKHGAEKADNQAKRCFEVYGGKEAKDPPLGRVSKKAKLQVEDFVMGSELTTYGSYHKAYTASSFISF